ncbi:MAG TPA: tRNA (adenine(22)-N(1))-methyltransferase TrmK [Bacillales bacterium]|nr:tRNA (adenine(22)-N(1))-methyltransferase TrmK [Bacillales bacterium]
MAKKLSERLRVVAEDIPYGSTMADIGSDHAYLPCFLCSRGQVKGAVAGEVADGPFHSASVAVREQSLEDMISVRKGDGLAVITPGEVDVVVVAGMGGKLISDILERGKEKLLGVKRLVLQPNVAAEVVRAWLMEQDWELKKERIMEEAGKIYEILIAEPGDGGAPYQSAGKAGFRFGPFLMQEKSPVFQKKWRAEIKKWKRIEAQLDQAAETEERARRKQILRQKIRETEEMLNG